MKAKMIGAALAVLMISSAANAFTKEQHAIIETLATASFANKCQGIHTLDNLGEVLDDAGFAPGDTGRDEFMLWSQRGWQTAETEYQKDPAAWCARTWQLLGLNHPPMIKHMLLTKD
jgi:hypothetical protein